MGRNISFIFVFCVTCSQYWWVSADSVLFPWGPSSGDILVPHPPLPNPDGGSSQYDLNFRVNLTLGPFTYHARSSNFAYINKQGFIHFNEDYPKSAPYVTLARFWDHFSSTSAPPRGYYGPAIIPFLAEVDPFRGTLYYRETTEKSVLQQVTQDIKMTFPSLKDLSVDWALVVTWANLSFWEPAYYHQSNSTCNCTPKKNTFQTILATTRKGQRSFVIMNYEKVMWIRNPWSDWEGAAHLRCLGERVPSIDNVTNVAGFTYNSLENSTVFSGLFNDGSNESLIMNLTDTTNVYNDGRDGRWVYKVDHELHAATICDFALTSVEQVRIYPSAICHLGHIPLKVRGPCLANTTNVECRFHEGGNNTVNPPQVTKGIVTSPNEVTCTAPLLQTMEGRVKVELALTYRKVSADGTEMKEDKSFYGYIYTFPPSPSVGWRTSLDFRITPTGEAQFAWDPYYFELNKDRLLQLTLVVLDMSRDTPEARPLKMSPYNTGSYTWSLGTSNMFKRRPKVGYFAYMSHVEAGDRVLYSQVIYTPLTGTKDEFAQLCEDWSATDTGVPVNISACPPLLSQASTDWSFNLEPYSPNPQGFIYRQSVTTRGSCQRCKYGTDGKLVYGPPLGATAYLKCPSNERNTFMMHQLSDIMPLHWCMFGDNLPLYFKKRNSRSSSAVGYEAPTVSLSRGDPHITTWDLASYTFNPVGEFWMIKKLSNPTFNMQVRMGQYKNANASVFTGFAVTQEPPAVHVQMAVSNAGVRLWVNRQEVEVDTIVMDEKAEDQPTMKMNVEGASLSIWRRKDASDMERAILVFSSGFTLDVSIPDQSDGPQYLNIMAGISKELRGSGKLIGLLGDFDGSPGNDLRSPPEIGKNIISPNSSLASIHKWGQQWRTTPEESIFMYFGNRTHSDFQDTSFSPNLQYPDPTSVSRNIQDLCGSMKECYFDFVSTGNPVVAKATKNAGIRFEQVREILERKPPVCTKPNCADVTDFTYPTTTSASKVTTVTGKPVTNVHGETVKPPAPTKKPSAATNTLSHSWLLFVSTTFVIYLVPRTVL